MSGWGVEGLGLFLQGLGMAFEVSGGVGVEGQLGKATIYHAQGLGFTGL